MITLDTAEKRALIRVADAQNIAQLLASDRSVLAREDVDDQIEQGPLILDGLRRRPRYFDGRFLTGADLTRDQDYVRQRQADMARAGGAGVISGLRVRNRTLTQGQTLSISAGVGLTPSGDVVMLSARRDVPLLDLPTSRQLDAALGLADEPRVPLGRRTGLFILALRPVEFTANPIAAYPRSITGRRTVEDGDIIEASAITLIPYPDMAGAANVAEARRKVARTIFAGRGSGMPQDALPLAMLGIDRGTVRWIDIAMVRRETGADSGVHAMFGSRSRAISEAFILQHYSHLTDVLSDFAGRGLTATFPAASMFSLLPPAGVMPGSMIQPDNFGFTQLYFPPGVDADLAFVPGDEIPALAEEALALPPIDLDAPAASLDTVGVTIMVPVDRPRYQRLRTMLGTANLSLAGSAAVAPGAGSAFDLISNIVARRKAAEAASRDAEAIAAEEREALRIKAWHGALTEALAALPPGPAGTPVVWYMRRRSIAQQPQVTGRGVALTGDDVQLNAMVNTNIDRLRLARRLATINGEATPQATVRLMALLGSPAIAASDVLTIAVLADIERVIKRDLPVTTPRPALPDISDFGLIDRRADRFGGLGPRVLGDFRLPTDLRPGLERIAAENAAGTSTAARADTELKLAEKEVMDVAEDYSDPQLGHGLERLATTIGDKWPDTKAALWLGESGQSLAVDLAFRSVAEERAGDFAALLKAAVAEQKLETLDDALTRMG